MFENLFKKPTTQPPPYPFSIREETLDLRVKNKNKGRKRWLYGDKIYVDENTGEKFHKLGKNENPEEQKLVSLMLKGVVNVSDVVQVEGNYFSHLENLDNIRPSDNLFAEMRADIYILATLFGDTDHLYSPSFFDRFRTVVEHSNMLLDVKSKKVNYFDFGSTSMSHSLGGLTIKNDILGLKKEFRKTLTSSRYERNLEFTDMSGVLAIIRDKVQKLLTFYQDDDFGTFKEIIKKSGIEIREIFKEEGVDEKERIQRVIFNNFRLRLKALDEMAVEMLEEAKIKQKNNYARDKRN